jgi:serine protease Do
MVYSSSRSSERFFNPAGGCHMRKTTYSILTLFLSLALLVPAGIGAERQQSEPVPMVPANFPELAEMVRPGVVNIRTERTIQGGGRVFRHFFGDPVRRRPAQSIRGIFRAFFRTTPARTPAAEFGIRLYHR